MTNMFESEDQARAVLRAHSTPDPEPHPDPAPPPPVPDDVPDPAHAPVEEPRLPEPPILVSQV